MDGDWDNVHLACSSLDELDGGIPDSLTNNASLLDWEHTLSYSSYDPALEIVYASFDIDLPLLECCDKPRPHPTFNSLTSCPIPNPVFAPNPAFDTPHLAINDVQPGAFDVVQPRAIPRKPSRTPLNTMPSFPTLPQDLGAHLSLASSTLSWTRDARRILNVLCPRCGKSICTGSKLQTRRKCCPSSISEACIESAEARALREQLLPPHSVQPQGLSVSAPYTSTARLCTPEDFEDGNTIEVDMDGTYNFLSWIPLDWPRPDFFHSYPFQRHNNSMFGFIGYKFCAVDADGSSFRIRSYRCAGTVSVDGDQSCTECLCSHRQSQTPRPDVKRGAPHTSYMYRSHSQLHQVTDGLHDDLSRLHCVALNLGRRVGSLLKKLDDHRRFLMAIATGDSRV
ncbi:hypothetical protein C8Q72DRAFT_871691, partial [Fomitopsis betulina]